MKAFLSTAIMLSFFAIVASLIWSVWDQREIASNTVATALIVFVSAWLFEVILLVEKELW